MNYNYIFNVENYKPLYSLLKNQNNEINDLGKYYNYKMENSLVDNYKQLAKQKIILKTTYPGLLIGLGYTHSSQQNSFKGEVKLGFMLDYTSGLPLIPGSTVKGILRSYFNNSELIAEFLNNKFTISEIKELLLNIFEEGKGKRDIFFDAIIISENIDIIGEDYTTPHRNELSNPIPLKMIRVLPDVIFQFNFDLQDTKLKNNKILTKDEKIQLFKKILLEFGVGAKTNVGYGVLREVK